MIFLRKKYDYLIIGAGIYGSVFAHELTKKGKKCLVIDKRNFIGGNCYTENVEGIHVHKFGAHIFHTNDKKIWDYITQFADFRNISHTVIANYKGEMFNLPFNMWTFNQLWGVNKPDDARKIIENQRFTGKVTNLEEQALSMVGQDIYEKLIKGYTEKQWNRECKHLPASIIKRLPVRFNWDTNYFNDRYVGMPIGGYTQIFEKLLDGVEVKLGLDYFEDREFLDGLAHKKIYTGPIDRFFDYRFGRLDYRSLEWETKILDTDNFQGNSVINYTDSETPYTRILEHKWFDPNNQSRTVVSYEYPKEYDYVNEPFYPVRDEANTKIYNQYNESTTKYRDFIFGGRLGSYVYYDMHQVIAQALKKIQELEEKNIL